MKPSSDLAKEQIDKTIGYLSERTDKVDYGKLKRGGYHIGSGGIESSNKFISNVRLKRSGTWWYPTNANNILKLRCAKYNGTFDRIMAEVKKRNKNELSQNKLGELRLVVDNSWELGNTPPRGFGCGESTYIFASKSHSEYGLFRYYGGVGAAHNKIANV